MSVNWIEFLTGAGIAIGIGIAGYLVMLLAGRLLQQLLERYMDSSLAQFISSLARLFIILGTAQIIINRTGAAGMLVIAITALTGAFAIGSERLASDFVAGVKLFTIRQYKVGDWITINGINGEVINITMTQTILKTEELDLIYIPNSDAADTVLINHSTILGHATPVTIPIVGKHDRTHAMEVMRKSADTFDNRLEDEKFDPEIYLHGYLQNTTLYRIIVWVNEDIWSFRNAYNVRLHLVQSLETAGFEVGTDTAYTTIS